MTPVSVWNSVPAPPSRKSSFYPLKSSFYPLLNVSSHLFIKSILFEVIFLSTPRSIKWCHYQINCQINPNRKHLSIKSSPQVLLLSRHLSITITSSFYSRQHPIKVCLYQVILLSSHHLSHHLVAKSILFVTISLSSKSRIKSCRDQVISPSSHFPLVIKSSPYQMWCLYI